MIWLMEAFQRHSARLSSPTGRTCKKKAASFILTSPFKVIRNPADQIWFPLYRDFAPFQQSRHRIDLNIADGIVGVIMEDLIPLDVLPFLPAPVVKMHDITLDTGE
jgi:hypothetical protein